MANMRTLLVAALLGFIASANAIKTRYTINELRQIAEHDAAVKSQVTRDVNPALLYPTYELAVPIDHFHNDSRYEPHTNATFNLRYWFDASNYKPGGPVIVLQGGETSGAGRLPFLQKGIVAKLTQATGGVGVILEHRYYGSSMPTEDLSTESLRFLTTEQALADMAYFASNVKYKGYEHIDLSPKGAPYIAYGGSYAGAFVALLRKIYPDVYWGAISSSGVTEAIYDYWAYYEAARLYAPGQCAPITQNLTNVIDNILIGMSGTTYVARLKKLFGLPNVTRNVDFAAALSGGITGLQSTNWDPALNDTSFGTYCDTMTSTKILYPNTASLRNEAVALLKVAGYASESPRLVTNMLNYIGYINKTVVQYCAGQSQDECLTNDNPDFYSQDDITQTWRSWPYQYCTEWGFLQTGSGTPKGQLSMISRLVDLPYSSIICREAFNITTEPALDRINKYGGYNISYPRLAIIDGEHDPWRQATPHAIGIPSRVSTIEQPFIQIAGAVHHWDENGLFPNQTTASLPPAPVADAQSQEIRFVTAWWKEWTKSRAHRGSKAGHGSTY